MDLQPCTACHRHVNTSDSRCPFCSARLPRTRTASSALLVAGLLATAGCDKEGEPKPTEPKVETPAKPEAPEKPAKPTKPEREPADIYGAPPPPQDEDVKPAPAEPVRAIYAGPPPRDPKPEPKPTPPDEK